MVVVAATTGAMKGVVAVATVVVIVAEDTMTGGKSCFGFPVDLVLH